VTVDSAATAITARQVLIRALAIVSVVTAVIHFVVAGEHYAEYWAFGVFMLGAAWFQLAWALGITLRPARPLLALGLVANSAIVAVYIVTRTAGDVIGPTPHAVEGVGFGDLFCTICEAALVAGTTVAVFVPLRRPVSRRRLTATSLTAALAAATLLSVVLVDGGSEMVMTAADDAPQAAPAGMNGMNGMNGMQAGRTTSISLPTASPAGPITTPKPTMQMEPGMKMTQSSCTAIPTPAQQAATVHLVNSSWTDDQKYQSLAAAKAAGFRPVTPPGLPVVHYINRANTRATLAGGPVLTPAAPQSLVYANTPTGAVLVAAMYISTKAQGTSPSPGGCLTQWHVHTNLCMAPHEGVVALADPTCPAGSVGRITSPMLHIWFVPVPGGPTAVDATDSQIVHAAESVTSPHNPSA
jgi:hypothetical protein